MPGSTQRSPTRARRGLAGAIGVLLLLGAAAVDGPTADEPLGVAINEVAWMGTQASAFDGWIELYNPTDADVDLANWSIFGAETGNCLNFGAADGAATTVIPAEGYLIYANHADDVQTDDGTNVVDVWDATVGLNDTDPGALALYDAPDCQGSAVDAVNEDGGDWPAGDSGTHATMERKDPTHAGTDANWATHDGSARNGQDADDNPIRGTPKAQNSVFNRFPTADAGSDRTRDEGTAVTLDGSASSDPDGDPIDCTWTPGDGSSPLSGCVVDHVYADNGSYATTLTVRDSTGNEDTDSATIDVRNVPPNVDAGADREARVGNEVDFAGAFDDPGTADTHTIEWDFGDGHAATGTLTPQHAYTAAGSYQVTLRVTDDDGGVGTDTLTVSVGAPHLSATKRDVDVTDPPLVAGDLLEYEIRITNTGRSAQPNNPDPEFTDPIPAQTSFVTGSLSATSGAAHFDADDGRIRWNGALAPQATTTLRYRVRVGHVPADTVITNQGQTQFDANGDGSNGATEPTDDPDTPEPGDSTKSPSVAFNADATGDGTVNVLDARACLQVAQGLLAPTPIQEAACDLDHDGQVDRTDVAKTAKLALGLTETPPSALPVIGLGLMLIGWPLLARSSQRIRWARRGMVIAVLASLTVVLTACPGLIPALPSGATGVKATVHPESIVIRAQDMPDGGLGAIEARSGGLTFDPEAIRVTKIASADGWEVLAQKIDNAQGRILFASVHPRTGIAAGRILTIHFTQTDGFRGRGSASVAWNAEQLTLGNATNAEITDFQTGSNP